MTARRRLIVGIIARVVMPSTRQVGLLGSALLGAAWGLVGGLLSSVFAPNRAASTVDPLGIVLAVAVSGLVTVGSIVVTRKKRFA